MKRVHKNPDKRMESAIVVPHLNAGVNKYKFTILTLTYYISILCYNDKGD